MYGKTQIFGGKLYPQFPPLHSVFLFLKKVSSVNVSKRQLKVVIVIVLPNLVN